MILASPSIIGLSWLGVFVTTRLPSTSMTSHAQPDPNWPRPAVSTASFIAATSPNSAAIASARAPVGSLLPPGVISSQNIVWRSEEHTSEFQSRENLVCRLLLEQKNTPPPRHGPTTAP